MVGRARRDDAENRPLERLAVGMVAVGLVGLQPGIVEVIDDLRLAMDHAREGERAAAGTQAETGVPLCARVLARLAIGPNDLELAGIDRRARRKGPLRKVGVVVRQIVSLQAQLVRAGVVEFDPGIPLAEAVGRPTQILPKAVGRPAQILRLQLV